MEENSPDFKVEISTFSPAASTTKEAVKPSKAKRPLRKVHRSNLGVFYTLLHILGQLAALVVGGWALYCYLENEGEEHYILGHLRWLTGLPENSVLAQEEEQRNFVIAALVCFVFGSFLQFFLVFLVITSPRFLAKNPSLSVHFIRCFINLNTFFSRPFGQWHCLSFYESPLKPSTNAPTPCVTTNFPSSGSLWAWLTASWSSTGIGMMTMIRQRYSGLSRGMLNLSNFRNKKFMNKETKEFKKTKI